MHLSGRARRGQLLVSHMDFVLRTVVGIHDLGDGFFSVEFRTRKRYLGGVRSGGPTSTSGRQER